MSISTFIDIEACVKCNDPQISHFGTLLILAGMFYNVILDRLLDLDLFLSLTTIMLCQCEPR